MACDRLVQEYVAPLGVEDRNIVFESPESIFKEFVRFALMRYILVTPVLYREIVFGWPCNFLWQLVGSFLRRAPSVQGTSAANIVGSLTTDSIPKFVGLFKNKTTATAGVQALIKYI